MIILNSQLRNHMLENDQFDCDKTEGEDLNQKHDFTQKQQQQQQQQQQQHQQQQWPKEEESANYMNRFYNLAGAWEKFDCWKTFTGPVSYIILGCMMSRITMTIPCEYDKHKQNQEEKSRLGFFFENLFYLNMHFAWVLIIGTVIVIVIAVGLGGHVLYSFALISYSKYQEKVVYQSNYEQCRKRIQMALGTIAAPSLLPQSKNYNAITSSRNNKSLRFIINGGRCENRVAPIVRLLQTISQFTEQHSNLLSTIDRSIQMIRVVTSIQLGLGPASLSVGRVENAFVHKQQQQQQHRTVSAPTMNLKTIRSEIFNSLEKEASSIQKIHTKLLSMKINETNDKNYNVDDELLFSSLNHLQSANLLTITLLKSTKIYTGEILSETLSLFFSSLPQFFSTDDGTKDIVIEIENLLYASTSIAEELEVYLSACLPGGERNRNGAFYRYNKNPHAKQISQLQSYIDGVSATFWAFQQSMENNEGNNYKEWSVETELLWKRLTGEICTVADLSSYINYHRDQTGNNNTKVNDDNNSIYDENTANSQKVNEMEEYHDKGQGIRPSSAMNSDSEHQTKLTKNKTLVFSGKGAKSTQRHTKKNQASKTGKEGSNTSSTTSEATRRILPQSFIGQQSRGRTILLRELQARLETLETAEEWDARTNQKFVVGGGDGDGDDTGTGCGLTNTIVGQQDLTISSTKSKSKSSEFFLGVSGSLLSELKGALLSQPNADGDLLLSTSEIE